MLVNIRYTKEAVDYNLKCQMMSLCVDNNIESECEKQP